MKLLSAHVLLAGIIGAGSVFLMGGAGQSRPAGTGPAPPASQSAKISIDYPLEGSVFPPEITPPTFLWRDASDSAKRWVVEVSFADDPSRIRVEAPGEHLQIGELDPQAGTLDEFPPLTPEQAATRTWRPNEDTWAQIKPHCAVAAQFAVAG